MFIVLGKSNSAWKIQYFACDFCLHLKCDVLSVSLIRAENLTAQENYSNILWSVYFHIYLKGLWQWGNTTYQIPYHVNRPFIVMYEVLKVSSNSAGVSVWLVKFFKPESTVKSAGEKVPFPTLSFPITHDCHTIFPKFTLLAGSKERNNEGGCAALTFPWILLNISRAKSHLANKEA